MPRRCRPLLLLTLGALLCACTAGDGRPAEDSDAECSDRVDNDGDSVVDCDDPECAAKAWCNGGPWPDAGGAGVDAGPRPRSDAGPRRDATIACAEPIDVVFVIDVSTSMEDEVASIRAGVDSIFDATTALSSNAQFSMVVFVDDVALVNGCAPFADREAMRGELMTWQSFTSSNQQPGGGGTPNGDCSENSLDALYLAAAACPWREGATRVLIHVTDDTFEERPATLSGVPVQHSYAETVAALTDREIRVGSFSAPGAGEYCGVATSPNVGRGFHEPFNGQPAIPEATGARAWSIRDVRAGTLDMAEAVNELIADEHCTLF